MFDGDVHNYLTIIPNCKPFNSLTLFYFKKEVGRAIYNKARIKM